MLFQGPDRVDLKPRKPYLDMLFALSLFDHTTSFAAIPRASSKRAVVIHETLCRRRICLARSGLSLWLLCCLISKRFTGGQKPFADPSVSFLASHSKTCSDSTRVDLSAGV
jgi:hypothetical protein